MSFFVILFLYFHWKTMEVVFLRFVVDDFHLNSFFKYNLYRGSTKDVKSVKPTKFYAHILV